jgi:hypothetical protein
VNDEPAGGERPGRLRPALPDDAELEPKTFFQLLPRRDLTKAALLVVFLIIIVVLQRRSGSIVKNLTQGLSAPVPVQVQPRQPPSVRLTPGKP